MKYSLQLFSVCEYAKENMADTLKKVKEIGYSGIEFAGFFGHSAEEIKKMLDDNGLYVSGAHVPLSEIRDNFEETLKFHKTIGNKYFIMPMEHLLCQGEIDKFVEDCNRLQPLLEKRGFRLGYHNHLHEFHKNSDGSLIYPQVVERTNVFLEMDVGWVNAGLQSPLELMDKYKDRIEFIHFRDTVQYKGKVCSEDLPSPLYDNVFKAKTGWPLGQGEVPLKEVYNRILENGYTAVVECEAKCPDGMTTIKTCMDYINVIDKNVGV